MDKNELERKIIEQYKENENMMILIFAQWCINNGLDPIDLYHRAYPGQALNAVLLKVLELTVTKEESENIPHESVLNVLQLFGNEDLAFIVAEEVEKMTP